MQRFIGYDPGGRSKKGNGVAAVHIAADGSYEGLVVDRFHDAARARDWLSKHTPASALGIDTLLAWSWHGKRKCDDALMGRYKAFGQRDRDYEPACRRCQLGLEAVYAGRVSPVISQNGLYSSMTLNSILVAKAFREDEPALAIAESHPKLLLCAARGLGPERKYLVRGYLEALHLEGGHKDDGADAFVAAWCASRWHYGYWKTNLLDDDLLRDDLAFPVQNVVYPWPESVV